MVTNCVFFNIREKKIEGLTFLRSLAHYHSDTLQGRLHYVCLSLIQEVYNLLYITLPDHFDLFSFCWFTLNLNSNCFTPDLYIDFCQIDDFNICLWFLLFDAEMILFPVMY